MQQILLYIHKTNSSVMDINGSVMDINGLVMDINGLVRDLFKYCQIYK